MLEAEGSIPTLTHSYSVTLQLIPQPYEPALSQHLAQSCHTPSSWLLNLCAMDHLDLVLSQLGTASPHRVVTSQHPQVQSLLGSWKLSKPAAVTCS